MTVFFDAPFWVCVLEVDDGEFVRATRHVFGAEPTDPQLYQFLLRHGAALLTAAHAAKGAPKAARKGKPKGKAVKRAVSQPSSAAQEAMRLDLESRKRAARVKTRDRRAAEAEQRREKAKAKARAKHRGH